MTALSPGSGCTFTARPRSYCENNHIVRILITNISP